MELREGTIPITEIERQGLATIPGLIGYSRTGPNETGPIQAEGQNGSIWLVSGKKVERIG